MGWERLSVQVYTLELFSFSPHKFITYTVEKLCIFIYYCVIFKLKLRGKLESKRRKSSVF